MKKLSLFILVLLFAVCNLTAQTTKQEVFDTPEKSGGVYYAYPSHEIVAQTPTPKGYEPFYISHFGRHGSRYLISDSDYKNVIDVLNTANQNNALTALGQDVLSRLYKVWEEVEYRGGDLSPLGVREQRGIAERMFQSYPEVFTDSVPIFACATTVVRCAMSMDAFCERLKELNPTLQTDRQSSMKYQRYLNHHTREAHDWRSDKNNWRKAYDDFLAAHTNPEQLMQSLFSDKNYVQTKVDSKALMRGLYGVASNMQNIETELSFYDIFEKQELFDLWQCSNYKVYVNDANYAGNNNLMFENCKPVLKDILNRAQTVINTKGKGADLRFAHDGNIIPLALLLHLNNCYNSVSEPADFYKAFSDFKVAPMAGNIQIIFFRNNENAEDIIVKFLLHEKEIAVPPIKTDIAPYYHWKDVEAYYTSLLK